MKVLRIGLMFLLMVSVVFATELPHVKMTSVGGSSSFNASANGTANYIPKFYNSTYLTDSNIYDNGNIVEFKSNITLGGYNISVIGGDLYIG